MSVFPFFRYPYINRYYPRPNTYLQENQMHHIPDNAEKKDASTNKEDIKNQKNKSSRYSDFGPIHFQNPFSMDSEEPILEILGISLYLDDIIILGLLFFLYQEQVKDDMLFLILILLLLS